MCNAGGVRCPDGTCVSPAERCDGEMHCSDGSDEPMTCGKIYLTFFFFYAFKLKLSLHKLLQLILTSSISSPFQVVFAP